MMTHIKWSRPGGWLQRLRRRVMHSFAVAYDAARPVELRGTVTKVDSGQSARSLIDVQDATRHRIEKWNFELASPNVLVHASHRGE